MKNFLNMSDKQLRVFKVILDTDDHQYLLFGKTLKLMEEAGIIEINPEKSKCWVNDEIFKLWCRRIVTATDKVRGE